MRQFTLVIKYISTMLLCAVRASNGQKKMSKVKSSTSTHVRVIGIPPHAGDEIYDEIVHRLSKLGGATIHKNKTLYYVDAHFNSSDMAQLAVEQFSAVNIPSGENLQCKMVETDNEREKKATATGCLLCCEKLTPRPAGCYCSNLPTFYRSTPGRRRGPSPCIPSSTSRIENAGHRRCRHKSRRITVCD